MATDRELPQKDEYAPARLDSVVIGLDYGAPSVAAASWVRQHFAPDAKSVVVHAIDMPRPPAFLRDAIASGEEVLKNARLGAVSRLEEIRDAENWGDVRIDVRDGRAENAIAEAARETGADLVIVGEHSRPRGIWTTLGSTAEALVRCSPVPVLLVRNPPANRPARILVAVDDSASALAAMRWAAMLAQRFDAELTAYHAFRPVFVGAATSVSGLEAGKSLESDQLRQTEDWFESHVRNANLGTDVSTVVESGDPASAVVAAQRGGNYDLVVLGTRGAGGVGQRLLGSVATAVLRGASCPVLVVR